MAQILAFSHDQRWMVTSSNDEQYPAQVWDLKAMRRELAKRNLDLPPDVLQANEISPSLEGQLEIVVDEAGLTDDSTPSASTTPSNAVNTSKNPDGARP